MAALGVLVAVRGADEAGVVATIDAHPGLTVVRRCADLAEAVACARAGLARVAIVSDQPQLDSDALAALREAGVAVIGVGSRARLDALGVSVAVGDLAHAALTAVDRPAPVLVPPPRGRGAMIAVWGTGGAPGRTTVAVNLAAEAALAGHRVLLVDLDTHGASVATALGLEDEAPGLAAVARAVSRGDDAAALLARHVQQAGERFDVLTGLTRAARWPEVTAAGLDRLWPALRDAADVIVLDVAASAEADGGGALDGRAPRRDAATLGALAEADVLLAVGGAEPHQLVRLVHLLLDHEGPTPVVAVNRIRASVAGSRPEDAIASALGRHAGVKEVWPLPWDLRSCDTAAREGRALAEAAPRSPLRRAIASMADVLVAAARASRTAAAPVPD